MLIEEMFSKKIHNFFKIILIVVCLINWLTWFVLEMKKYYMFKFVEITNDDQSHKSYTEYKTYIFSLKTEGS